MYICINVYMYIYIRELKHQFGNEKYKSELTKKVLEEIPEQLTSYYEVIHI